MKTRENGFYWVKYDGTEDWEIAEYCTGDWWRIGSEFPETGRNIIEIDERRIERTEQ